MPIHPPLGQQQKGDLIFFKGTNPKKPKGSITHVGLVLDQCHFSQAVRRKVAGQDANVDTYCTGKWAPGNGHFVGFGRAITSTGPINA